jgi:hypothetical protein
VSPDINHNGGSVKVSAALVAQKGPFAVALLAGKTYVWWAGSRNRLCARARP